MRCNGLPLTMYGPYELNNYNIDDKVRRESPGNYALVIKRNGIYETRYIGRSDTDLNARLKAWIGKTNNPLFVFCYADSAKMAFEKECEDYHYLKPPENEAHPDRPDNTDWRCPRCDKFG